MMSQGFPDDPTGRHSLLWASEGTRKQFRARSPVLGSLPMPTVETLPVSRANRKLSPARKVRFEELRELVGTRRLWADGGVFGSNDIPCLTLRDHLAKGMLRF